MKLTAADDGSGRRHLHRLDLDRRKLPRMVSIPGTSLSLLNTIIYVACTLTLFNIGFAMVLAITTFDMPEQTAGFFRTNT